MDNKKSPSEQEDRKEKWGKDMEIWKERREGGREGGTGDIKVGCLKKATQHKREERGSKIVFSVGTLEGLDV